MAVFHSTHPFMMRKKFLLTSSASNNIFQTKTQHVFCLWTAVVLGTHGSVGIGMSVGSSGPMGGQVVVGKWWGGPLPTMLTGSAGWGSQSAWKRQVH